MPCENPKVIRNKKYLPNKSNGGFPPPCPDPRLRSLTVPCGKCYSCRKRYANDWRFRLHQEYRHHDTKRFHFITLTFSDSSLDHLRSEYRRLYNREPDYNELCQLAIRRFLERYRKQYGVSLRHFLITELGEKTERIHLHGMIIDCRCGIWRRGKYYADFKKLTELWKYGTIWLGWCNDESISYICKYITKVGPNDHVKNFRPAVFVSPGFGKGYVNDFTITLHRTSDGGRGMWFVTSSNGYRMAIPRYLRLKLFTPEQLEARAIFVLNNPPPYEIKKVVYPDFLSYRKKLYSEFMHNISLRLSYRPSPVILLNTDLQPNNEFLI